MLTKVRNVLLVLLGAAGLVLKRQYVGPYETVVRSYGGNVAASFAVYFVVANLPFRSRFRSLVTAGLALAIVELFEALNGFGVMSNVYDQVDFGANAVGIALALAADTQTRGICNRTSNEDEQTASARRGRPAV